MVSETGSWLICHDTVFLHLVTATSHPPRKKYISYTCSSDPTGKAMIYYHLKHFNWSLLYCMDSCKTMVQYFYSVFLSFWTITFPLFVIIPLIVTNLGSLPVSRVLASCQISTACILSGQSSLYCNLQNKTQRVAKTLRKKYFEKKIESLHTLDPHSWWTKTKWFLYSSKPNPLQALEGGQPDTTITDVINDLFCQSCWWTFTSYTICVTLSVTLLKSTNVFLLLKSASFQAPALS